MAAAMIRLLILFLFVACAAPQAKAPLAATAPKDDMTALARDYWDAHLRTNPLEATRIGDHRFDAEVDDLSPAGHAAAEKIARGFLQRAAALEPKTLSHEDRLSRDVLIDLLTSDLAVDAACHFENWQIDHLYGAQVTWAETASAQPAGTAKAARELIARYQKMPTFFLQHESNLRVGLSKGWVAAQINVSRLVSQLEEMVRTPLEQSPYLPKEASVALDASPEERAEIYALIKKEVESDVRPALQGYLTFAKHELLPKSRMQPGLSALPFAAPCYAAVIAQYLGSEHAPKDLHQLGLQEVDRIRAEMLELAQKAHFKSIVEYQRALEKDPKQHLSTRDALQKYATDILARAIAAAPAAVTLPETHIEVRPLEAYREKESPAAYYGSAPQDGSRPAYFWLNTYTPESRGLYTLEALTFHEGVPGHHVQQAIARELKSVPTFRRNVGPDAFVEGWALYAERLAKELNLYSSEAADFGRLTYELWRAYRLVIDTGLHSEGWSREQSIRTLAEGTGLAEVEVVNEVDRYITWPGQALAYKVGEIEIRRLRALAEERLGGAFDERAFHDEFLRHGALPLPVATKMMERWIDAEGMKQQGAASAPTEQHVR